ncbi:tRNA-guanine transglycosylase [Legionella sp.]|uniref:tRNA-guanine transglycosylase n=1 Tax=Legionella sp. TaxID=459 RepID=UPI003C86DA59
MLVVKKNFIPVVTSQAGLCLTAENWHEAKATALSYSLEFLLHKPGQEVLRKITNLPHYLGWSGTLILNATSLVANREGTYTLKSPYDGSKIKLTSFELIELVQHLKPDGIILPKNILRNCALIWEKWPDAIIPFIHVEDCQSEEIGRTHGVYFNDINESTLIQLEQWSHLPRYVMGTINAELLHYIRSKDVEFIESDEPANAALHGRVYSQRGDIDLTDCSTEKQFETIDPDCNCPVCSQQFTKAYFHHLLQHTPLLCQRLLIQHNVFWLAK